MDRLTLLAVLWAAAGTHTLLHLMKNVSKYLDSRAPRVLRVAGVWPSHVLPDPGLVVGLLQPSGAHLSKLPERLRCLQPRVRMGGQASVRDKGELSGRQAS